MTKRTNSFLLFAGVIFFSLIFVANYAKAGCQSANLTCSGTVVSSPGIEKNCVSDEVWCEPASFPVETIKKIGDPCPDGKGCPTGSSCIANAQSVFVCKAGAAAKQANGYTCIENSDCQSNSCVDMVCAQKIGGGGGNGEGGNTGNGGGAATGNGWSLGSISGFGLPSSSISGIVKGILIWLLGGLGIIGVIGFVISGIMYLVSTGDEGMIDKAKEAMKYSIMGVIVGLIGVVIIQAIDWMLRGFSNF